MRYTAQIITVILLLSAIFVFTVPGICAPVLAGEDSGFVPEADYAGNDWFELSRDGKALSIHFKKLPSDYKWLYGLSGRVIQEKDISRNFNPAGTDGWKDTFVPSEKEDGECILTFQCVFRGGEKPVETRRIRVKTENGRIVEAVEH